MCVCFEIYVLNIFFFWEMILRVQNVVWILGYVACLIAFISVFFSYWKIVFRQSRHLLDTSQYLAYLLRFLVDFLSQSRHLSIARWIDRESSCPLDSFSTPLNLSRSSCMHCFSYVLHLFVILSSIASCFITFIHFYGFLLPPWLSLIICMFLGWGFIASYTLCQ